MQRRKIQRRLRFIRWFLGVMGVLLLGWWPLSHWFYADWYQRLLGFTPGSYSIALVRVIGTCGLIPVLLALMAARHPRRNRDRVIVLVIFSILMALTYLHLIWAGLFPPGEYFNAAVCAMAALTLLGAYPWRGLGRADPA
jgi:hypothetical protein